MILYNLRTTTKGIKKLLMLRIMLCKATKTVSFCSDLLNIEMLKFILKIILLNLHTTTAMMRMGLMETMRIYTTIVLNSIFTSAFTLLSIPLSILLFCYFYFNDSPIHAFEPFNTFELSFGETLN